MLTFLCFLGRDDDHDESGLGDLYETLVDPRLNYEQSIELAMLVGQKLS